MKILTSLAFAAAMLTAPGWIVTPAQAMTMEECVASHSQGYCEAALGTESISPGNYETEEPDPCTLKTSTLVALAC